MVQQKALLLLERAGDFAIRNVDIPSPHAGELLVEIKSTALNPADWKLAQLGLFITEYPAVLGTDSAGIVKEVGEGVTEFQVGDRVVHQGFFTNRAATFQQYTIVPATTAAKIPDNLTFDQAATVPVALTAVIYGLFGNVNPGGYGGAGLTPFWEKDGRGKYAGKPILIIGGSSSVGQLAIQVARLSGFSPIITTASLRHTAILESLGATHVIDRSIPLGPAVKTAISEPIAFVYDAISSEETQNEGWDLLAPGGSILIVNPVGIAEAKLEEGKQQGKASISVLGSTWLPDQGDIGLRFYKHLTAMLASGDIKPNAVEVLPNGLAGIVEGLDRLCKGQVSASKLVVHPQETK